MASRIKKTLMSYFTPILLAIFSKKKKPEIETPESHLPPHEVR